MCSYHHPTLQMRKCKLKKDRIFSRSPTYKSLGSELWFTWVQCAPFYHTAILKLCPPYLPPNPQAHAHLSNLQDMLLRTLSLKQFFHISTSCSRTWSNSLNIRETQNAPHCLLMPTPCLTLPWMLTHFLQSTSISLLFPLTAFVDLKLSSSWSFLH